MDTCIISNDVDRQLNETVTDKIRAYHTDYNNRPSNAISFMPPIVSTSGCLQFTQWIFVSSIFTSSAGNWPFFYGFRSSVCATYQWTLPLPSCGVLLTDQSQSGEHPRHWVAKVEALRIPVSSINLVSILGVSSPPHNPVYVRRV
jgi:hypothetical protein